jgi:hypothetical protein
VILDTQIKIKERLLQYQPYFSAGYINAYIEPITGIIHVGEEVLFPNDSLGDYFYLRVPDSGRFIVNNTLKISDCSGDGYQITMPVYLVACVRNADPDKLISNIINVIRTIEGVRLADFIVNSESVVVREMSKVKDRNSLMTSLKNLCDSYTIVSVGFAINSTLDTYTKPDCLPNPCKECE